MFEWNEDVGVRDTIWGVLNDTENNIVPYPKGRQYDTYCTFSEFPRQQRHAQSKIYFGITEQRKFDSKNEFPGPSLGCNSNFHTNEEFSAPRFDMDTWPDLPSLNSTFSSEMNHVDTMSSKFIINDNRKSPNMETVAENMVTELYDANAVLHNRDDSLNNTCSFSASDITKLNSERDMFVDGHKDKECDSFFNCDWADIADFDDFDRIFRNEDSIFGHEIISNADEILSPSMNADSITVPSFPMHRSSNFCLQDLPVTIERGAGKEFSMLKMDEQPGIASKLLEKDKVADSIVTVAKEEPYQSQLNHETYGRGDRLSVKVDRPKKFTKSRKKMEQKSKLRTPQKLSCSYPSHMSDIQQFENIKVHTPTKPHLEYQSAVSCETREDERPGYMVLLPGISQNFLSGCDYPMHSLPVMPMLSPAHPEDKQTQSMAVSHLSSKHTTNYQSKPLSMTPQEKLEKLRRRQQLQAMLAIQQQQQQLGQQSTSTEMSVSQTSTQMNQSYGSAASSEIDDETTKWLSSSELNIALERDEFQKIPTLIDDSLGETIFYQLQDAIGKLDIGLRLCIRDSLFRLARSATERQNAGDRSRINKCSLEEDEILVNEETNSQYRPMKLTAETGTNPIDRLVAHLLFHWPSEPGSRPAKEDILTSQMSSNRASKRPSANGNMSKENQIDEAEELEMQTSMCSSVLASGGVATVSATFDVRGSVE